MHKLQKKWNKILKKAFWIWDKNIDDMVEFWTIWTILEKTFDNDNKDSGNNFWHL